MGADVRPGTRDKTRMSRKGKYNQSRVLVLKYYELASERVT